MEVGEWGFITYKDPGRSLGQLEEGFRGNYSHVIQRSQTGLPASLGRHSESCHGYFALFSPAGTAKPNGVGGAPPLQVLYPKSEFLGREDCTR
jgi:hypothetical protein